VNRAIAAPVLKTGRIITTMREFRGKVAVITGAKKEKSK